MRVILILSASVLTFAPCLPHQTALDSASAGAWVLPPNYQVNSPAASIDMDGVQGSNTLPAFILKILPCGQPTPGTLNISSVNLSEYLEIAINTLPLVGPYHGGMLFPDGQKLNLNIMAGGVTFLAGGLWPAFQPVPPTGSASVNLLFQNPTHFSFQGIFTDAAATFGFTLSQPTQVVADLASATPTVNGPVLDDSSVQIDVVTPPTCWTSAGIPFYGTVYTQMHVISNGRVMFGPVANVSFGPSIASTLTDGPSVGFWTDLNPASGGTILAYDPGYEFVRVQYTNVPYYGESAGPSFAIEFDAATGQVVLDTVWGIIPNPQTGTSLVAGDSQWLGISPGNLLGATDPGPVTFTAGGVGGVAAATDMICDWALQPIPGGLCNSLVPGTLNTIHFAPDPSMSPNYYWWAY